MLQLYSTGSTARLSAWLAKSLTKQPHNPACRTGLVTRHMDNSLVAHAAVVAQWWLWQVAFLTPAPIISHGSLQHLSAQTTTQGITVPDTLKHAVMLHTHAQRERRRGEDPKLEEGSSFCGVPNPLTAWPCQTLLVQQPQLSALRHGQPYYAVNHVTATLRRSVQHTVCALVPNLLCLAGLLLIRLIHVQDIAA